MTEVIEIKLDMISLRDDLRPRDIINDDIVDEYRENIADLPPIFIAIDSAGYVLIDGWHRYRAHEEAGHDTIMAVLDSELKSEDFFFTAVRLNKAHGIRFDAAEKKRISERLFIQENRTAAEISEAVGCSTRHANELIKELAHEKKQIAMQLAEEWQDRLSTREIAAGLKALGYKTSKSAVSRWLQKSHVTIPEGGTIDVQLESPQIGESPKQDTEQLVNEGGQPIDKEDRILNVSGEVATVALMKSATTATTRICICPNCKIRTVRIPKYIPGSCTKLFIYCDRCDEYIEIGMLLPKKD